MSYLSKHMSPFHVNTKRVPNSKLRDKTTINTSETTKGKKHKFKEKVRSTTEVHDIEGSEKGKKLYLDVTQKTKSKAIGKGTKSKYKQFYSDGERSSIQKQGGFGRGNKLRERKTTKRGAKRRIKKAEKNLNT